MEAISARKDEKPDSNAASLDLPGDSALKVEGASGQCPGRAVTFPDLLPPLAESPLGPFVDEEDLREACWRSHFFHASRERGAQ